MWRGVRQIYTYHMAKETYSYGKRDLVCGKRNLVYGKRDLLTLAYLTRPKDGCGPREDPEFGYIFVQALRHARVGRSLPYTRSLLHMTGSLLPFGDDPEFVKFLFRLS